MSPSGDAAVVDTPAPAEPWVWHLRRAIGVVLSVAVPIWFVSWFVVPDFGQLTVVDLRQRWSSPGWLVLDAVVLVLGLVHSAFGVSSLVAATTTDARRRLVADAVIWGLAAALVALALWTFVSFDV